MNFIASTDVSSRRGVRARGQLSAESQQKQRKLGNNLH
jgi:hypothetical protein